MIWIDDLVVLEPALLRDGIHLRENAISAERLALALARCRAATRAHVLAHVEAGFAAAVESALHHAADADEEAVFAAQLDLIAIYMWHIVYRKFPEEYEKFVACQRYRFDRLFPPALYAGAAVLDIGCGTGKLLDHLSTTAGRIYGVDPLPGMLRVARSKHHANARVHFAAGTFRDIPLPDGSMDFIVSNMAFQFHERGGGSAGLASMKRVLRGGGEIRLTVESARTQRFLLANGFEEDFVPLGLRYESAPPGASPLLQFLLTVAEQGWTSAAAGSRAQSKWRFGWTIENLAALAAGTPWRSAFHDGRLNAPLGVPVYRWRKARRATGCVPADPE
jgi:SAM-dependent methyltransferase